MIKEYATRISSIWIVMFFLTLITASRSVEVTNKRPIWNIAHMVNSLTEVDFYLNQGANGLEFDVQFDSQGNAIYTHHGFPCDFLRKWWMREDIDVYLEKMRQLTTPGNNEFRKNLVLLFLDLKVGKLTPSALRYGSKNLANKLKDIYWKRGKSKAQAYLVLALPSLKQIEFIGNFFKTLQENDLSFYSNKVGFTFFDNEDVKTIHSVLNTAHINHHIWQGDGITNWLPRGYGRLKKVITMRNEDKSSYFNKVYWWTVDKMSTMREVLSLGVDAITTNYPDRLSEALKEFSNYLRLANIEDNPWGKYPRNEIIPLTFGSSWFLKTSWQNEEL